MSSRRASAGSPSERIVAAMASASDAAVDAAAVAAVAAAAAPALAAALAALLSSLAASLAVAFSALAAALVSDRTSLALARSALAASFSAARLALAAAFSALAFALAASLSSAPPPPASAGSSADGLAGLTNGTSPALGSVRRPPYLSMSSLYCAAARLACRSSILYIPRVFSATSGSEKWTRGSTPRALRSATWHDTMYRWSTSFGPASTFFPLFFMKALAMASFWGVPDIFSRSTPCSSRKTCLSASMSAMGSIPLSRRSRLRSSTSMTSWASLAALSASYFLSYAARADLPSALSTRFASAMNASNSSNDLLRLSSSAVFIALTMGVSSFFIDGRRTMGADAAFAGGTTARLFGRARRAARPVRTARPAGRARRPGDRGGSGPRIPSPSRPLVSANTPSARPSPLPSSSVGDAWSRPKRGIVSAAPSRIAGAKESTTEVEQHPISRTSLPPRLFMVDCWC
mmetsp:Transcript_5472/g.12687  ORF Transcript_5472/g.12687 Transcript_5472/m.12687 type:complete len:463 (+) Transcript_5472:341-1729(+)